MDCLKCDKRDSCTELCPEAVEFANQDIVSQTELLPDHPITYSAPFPTTKCKHEVVLVEYFLRRKTQSQIAEMLGVSQQYISKIICLYKKIIAENLKKAVVLRP